MLLVSQYHSDLCYVEDVPLVHLGACGDGLCSRIRGVSQAASLFPSACVPSWRT